MAIFIVTSNYKKTNLCIQELLRQQPEQMQSQNRQSRETSCNSQPDLSDQLEVNSYTIYSTRKKRCQAMLYTSKNPAGFTLTEVLITVAILGILASIALPNYFKQMARTRQNECSALISQVITSTMAFNDEFSQPPENWSEINSMMAIMLESGTASSIDNFNPLDLRGGHYSMTQSEERKGNNIIYTFTCDPRGSVSENYNVEGCVSLFNGATDIRLGDGSSPAQTVDCI